MEKLIKPIFESGLEITLESERGSYLVYLFDTFHKEKLNVRTFKDYDKALKNFNTRSVGL